MRRGYVVPMMWVVIWEDVVPGGPLNLNSTNLPRPWSSRESSPSGKFPTVESGIEPGTSWLVGRDSEKPTQNMVTTGILHFRENSHGIAGNRTRDLMISRQRLWPLDREAGQNERCQKTEIERSLLLKRWVVCSMPVTVERVVTRISGVSHVTHIVKELHTVR